MARRKISPWNRVMSRTSSPPMATPVSDSVV
jgi:hypothetical protein